MRITVELIQRAPQYMNPLREREINLRGLNIPLIENLGVTLDQFDCMDLTNNEVSKLDDTAPLQRLSTLLLCNNEVAKISAAFGKNLPNLENLILSRNKIRDFSSVDNLAKHCTKLKRASFLGNLIEKMPNYRLYLIHKIPSLTVLDFKKITANERLAANELFRNVSSAEVATEDGPVKKEKRGSEGPSYLQGLDESL